MLRLRLLASTILAAAWMTNAALAEYPDEDVVLTTQSGPGAQTDIGIRTAVPFIEACLGNGATIVVQNKPGSNGDVNNTFLATAVPDGYTMGVVNVPGVVSNGIAAKREYSVNSYEYLGGLTGGMVMISVRKDSPFKTLDELLKSMKESAQPLMISSGGKGSSEHLALLQLERLVPGIKFNLIPFNDSASAINGILGGHVQATAASGVESMQDQVTTLAIALAERLPTLPDVPTFREQGVDLVGGSNHIYVVPKGTPPDITAKLRSCVEAVADNPEYRALAKERQLHDLRLTGAEAEKMVHERDKLLRDIWATMPWIDQ